MTSLNIEETDKVKITLTRAQLDYIVKSLDLRIALLNLNEADDCFEEFEFSLNLRYKISNRLQRNMNVRRSKYLESQARISNMRHFK